MDFEKIYAKVRGIVLRASKDYYIHLWEKGDWEQEGMMVLHELLVKVPGVEGSDEQLFRFYKTKFRNHIHDLIRKQESQKRRLDRQVYEEVSEIGHKLCISELFLDELVLFRQSLADYKSGLSLEEKEKYERLIADERFKGRKAMLRDMQERLKDFDPWG